jgi:primosomal protein DnaI
MEEIKMSYVKVDKEKIAEELSNDITLRHFFIDNDLSSEQIEENLTRLLSFKTENAKCLACEGLNTCTQDTIGHKPSLAFENAKMKTFYQECNFLVFRNRTLEKESLIDAMYMPKMILNAKLNDYELNSESRKELYNYMMRFAKLYSTGEKMLGMYIHGEYQRGKTYTLAALANEITKQGFKVVLAYYPDLVRELKSSIGNNTLESLINKLKQADILMLDDIGGESNSSWVRDEVLGPILQYRLLDEKPTFFSSNLSIKDLALNMTENNQRASQMKAARIAARIKSLTKEFQLK